MSTTATAEEETAILSFTLPGITHAQLVLRGVRAGAAAERIRHGAYGAVLWLLRRALGAEVDVTGESVQDSTLPSHERDPLGADLGAAAVDDDAERGGDAEAWAALSSTLRDEVDRLGADGAGLGRQRAVRAYSLGVADRVALLAQDGSEPLHAPPEPEHLGPEPVWWFTLWNLRGEAFLTRSSRVVGERVGGIRFCARSCIVRHFASLVECNAYATGAQLLFLPEEV